MKRFGKIWQGVFLGLLLVSLPGGAGGQDAAEPAELTAMRAEYMKALDAARKPVMKSYGLALRQKMKEFTQAGKLDEALAFKREMEIIAAELMKDLPKTPGAPPRVAERSNRIDFLEIIDIELDAKPKEKWMLEDGQLMCVKGSMVPKIILPYEPPEEYDITMTFEQPRLRNGLSFIIPNGAGSVFTVCAAERGGLMSGLSVGGRYDPAYCKMKVGQFKPDTEYTLTVEVREDSITGKVDGKEIFEYDGDRTLLETIVWLKHPQVTQLAISADDPAVISKLELTEIKGTGKMLRK